MGSEEPDNSSAADSSATDNSAADRKASGVGWLLLSGFGAGWLIGLSVSPVLHIVLGSVIAVITGAAGALAGLRVEATSAETDKPANQDDNAADTNTSPTKRNEHTVSVDPRPLAFVVIGLVLGSGSGTFARTNEFLGPIPGHIADRWGGVNSLLNRAQREQRVFDTLYPPHEEKTANESSKDKHGGEHASPFSTPGLFKLNQSDCAVIRYLHGAELRGVLEGFEEKDIDALLAKCKRGDDLCVENIKKQICSYAH